MAQLHAGYTIVSYYLFSGIERHVVYFLFLARPFLVVRNKYLQQEATLVLNLPVLDGIVSFQQWNSEFSTVHLIKCYSLDPKLYDSTRIIAL